MEHLFKGEAYRPYRLGIILVCDFYFGGVAEYTNSKKLTLTKFNDEKYEEKSIMFSFNFVFYLIIFCGGTRYSAGCDLCRQNIALATLPRQQTSTS
ncbi:MAG: hypothetical protein LBH59_03630 [Planctomycetaceae bacterium]|nr:hypothetical protein [Planctomycetaceae bacterium]